MERTPPVSAPDMSPTVQQEVARLAGMLVFASAAADQTFHQANAAGLACGIAGPIRNRFTAPSAIVAIR